MKTRLRQAVPAAVALFTLATVSVGTAEASPAPGAAAAATPWTGTWATAMQGTGATFTDQTIRQIVHTSIGGSSVRIHLSNRFGTQPVVLDDIHAASSLFNSDIATGTDAKLTFGGNTSVTIPAGGEAVSDPAGFSVTPESEVAVSFHVPGTAVATQHDAARQVNWYAPGDQSAAPYLSSAQQSYSYTFLSGLDVQNPDAAGAVVAFGASITDGEASSGNTNRRWPNRLATRLNEAGYQVGVLNEGISGNNLLQNGGGPAAVSRFAHDALDQPGVRWVVFSDDPINDIINTNPPVSSITGALRQLVDAAHARNVKFLCSTLTPFKGFTWWSDDREVKRQAVNDFLRGPDSGCDGVIDQAAATGDPADPRAYLPAYDAGDHLHPNDAGLKAIADAVPLSLFGTPSGPAFADLALGRPVETSSAQSGSGFTGDKAVDGDLTTRWAANAGDPQSLTVDLGAARNFSRIRLNWYAPVAEYQIQTSPDKNTWTTVASPAGVRTIEDFAVTATARYVRVNATRSGTPYGTSLWGISVYGTPAPASSLSATFDNTGVTSDADTDAGNFDGGGATYSAQALAAAGLRAGRTFDVGGVSFVWPSTAGSGKPDNTVAFGQSFSVQQAGGSTTLGFLASGSYGGANANGTITYTDGTVQSYTLLIPDWFGAGAEAAAVAAYQNRPGETRFDGPASVYFAGIALQPGKTIDHVRLPEVSSRAAAGTPSVHVFAVSAVKTGATGGPTGRIVGKKCAGVNGDLAVDGARVVLDTCDTTAAQQ
ncbi:discoidin domain-containing protein [Actinacidiphila sp. bgisy167]|uniref:discoidin domain-containing protein n=1 Tax=Actinacidiphila sp. bgisy167 TaxID=3413797 RepID=UPI003D74F467